MALIQIVRPKMGLAWEQGAAKINAQYEYSRWFHDREAKADRGEQNASLSGGYDKGAFYAKGSAGINDSAQPLNSTIANIMVMRQWDLAGTGGVKIGDGRLEVDQRYKYLTNDLAGLGFFEYDQWLATLRGRAKLAEPLTGRLQASYGRTDFFETFKQDNDIYEGLAGAIWVFAKGFQLDGDVGIQTRNYFGGPGVGPQFGGNFKSMVRNLAVRWADGPDRLTVSFSRSPDESSLSNYVLNQTGRLAYTRTVGQRFSATVTSSAQRSTEAVSVGQKIKKSYSAGGVLDFAILRSLLTEFNLQYRVKETDDGAGEYDNWKTSLSLTWKYGLQD